MAKGRLPHLEALVSRGSYNKLATRQPTLSPLIWTTMATGMVPEKHGISAFAMPVPGSESVTQIDLPHRHGPICVVFQGKAPSRMHEQVVQIEMNRIPYGTAILGSKMTTHRWMLPEGGKAILRFGGSILRDNSRAWWLTAVGRVLVQEGASPAKPLPQKAYRGIYRKPIRVDGKSYFRFGRARWVTVSSNLRRVKAIWNILSDQGRTSLVAGYWATWPAETIKGTIISNLTRASFSNASSRFAFTDSLPHQTYPEELIKDLEPITAHAIAWGKKRFPALMKRIPASFDKKKQRAELVNNVAVKDAFNTWTAVSLLKQHDYDLAIVYLNETDAASHKFSALGSDLTQGGVAEAYERADARVGELLAAVPMDRTNVVVLSDHGFEFNQKGIFQHTETCPTGILIMAGASIVPGGVSETAGVLDIGPTLLALLGLPASTQMGGRVLSELLDTPILPRIATYETPGNRSSQMPIESPLEEEAKKQLRGLGYIK